MATVVFGTADHVEQIAKVALIVSFLLSDGAMLVRGQAVNADAG